MDINSLAVLHQRKTDNFAISPLHDLKSGVFYLDSCQRRLWFGKRSNLEAHAGFEFFKGEDAYSFLLRVATGLESAILGETDIFGQLKLAWAEHERRDVEAANLRSWMQNLFEDTKDIRSQYLENLGGGSYGSLARMLLKPEPNDKVLIVGAGQIAQAVAPFFVNSELWLWNRSTARRDELAAELQTQGAKKIQMVEGVVGEIEAFSQADHVIICIPLNDKTDSDWVSFRERRFLGTEKPTGAVLHLGCRRGQAPMTWERLPDFFSLNDVFDLRASQSNVRDTQVLRARLACQERARLRRLGRSLSIAHGWEDLTTFVL